MKKQKNIKTLIASIAILALTAGSLGTATYAWFTRGTQATATGFDFTASAASGIQISTDALNWVTNITESNFDTVLAAGGVQEGNRLTVPSMEPLSTIDGIENLTAGKFDFFSATSGDGNYTIASDTSNYLVFDLYFLNSGANPLTLSLTNTSAVIDGANDEDTSLSTRVGFVVEGNNSTPAEAVALAGGVSTYIWEPNSTTHSAAALAKGAVNSAKYEYYGVHTAPAGAITDVDAYGYLEHNAAYTTLVNTTNDIAIGDNPNITVLAANGQITKIKVFVWMEGQDIDCTNAASTGDVAINFAFDSGAASTKLEAKTATGFTTDTVTTLSLDGTGNVSAIYNAYVFRADTDALTGVQIRRYLATGTDTYGASDIMSLELNNVVSIAGTYSVVVTAKFTGAESTITVTPITIS